MPGGAIIGNGNGVEAKIKCKVNVRIDSYRGKVVASIEMAPDESTKTVGLISGVVGKHAVYFEFLSDEDGVVATFDRFTFDN